MAQADLERARGEAAVLRKMANTAKLVKDNPEIIQLRILQTMASTQANAYVVEQLNIKAL